MNIHHCVFKTVGKYQSATDRHYDGRTDGQCENSIPHHKESLQGYNNKKEVVSAFKDMWLLLMIRMCTQKRVTTASKGFVFVTLDLFYCKQFFNIQLLQVSLSSYKTENSVGIFKSISYIQIISQTIIMIITLFQEDNIFGTNASLAYGPKVLL